MDDEGKLSKPNTVAAELHRNKVREWIEHQGFPLEMQVANAFLEAGFRTIQADYYTDPDTKASREIDVVASVQSLSGKQLIRLNIVVECKVAKDKPWILLTSSRTRLTPQAQVAQQAATRLGRKLLFKAAELDVYQQLPLFRSPERPAYGVLQAFASGNDAAYAASMSAAKASASLITEADTERDYKLAEIVIPAVVIDGFLFECHLGQGGQLEIESVEDGMLVWRNPIVGMPHTMIHASFSLPFLAKFVGKAKQAGKLILDKDGMSKFLS